MRVGVLAAAGLGLTAITLALGSGPRASQAPLLRAAPGALAAEAVEPVAIPVPQFTKKAT